MKTDISKSQLEVWEWKERLYDELKSVPKNERLKFIRNKVKATVEKLKKNRSKT